MRNLHNWIKSVLIDKYCPSGAYVLDLAGGKGGDLLKYTIKKIDHLFLVDIASESVKAALGRYNSSLEKWKHRKSHFFTARFMVGDCGIHDIWAHVNPMERVNFVSCQFALHYFFESENRIRSLLYNVSSRLALGGHFIATFPNSDRIVHKCRQTNSPIISNPIYSIKFDTDPSGVLVLKSYGCAYTMWLQDCIDHCREYLVHVPTLISLAQEFGLELVKYQEFPQIVHENMNNPTYHSLLKKLQVLNSHGTIDSKEWQVTSLYSAIIFKKARSLFNIPDISRDKYYVNSQRKFMIHKNLAYPLQLNPKAILSARYHIKPKYLHPNSSVFHSESRSSLSVN